MVASKLKEETLKLMNERTALEAEMDSIISRLCVPGGPGLSGKLTDSEGFPRPDIDIPVILAERGRLSVLKKDYSDITEKINQNIQFLHSTVPSQDPSSSADLASVYYGDKASMGNLISDNVVKPQSKDAEIGLPFAVIEEISDRSPVAEDGLQLGDLIVKFGVLEYQEGDNLLQKMSSEAHANRGQAIPIIILRQGIPINLTVTPREWQGRGLLGCSFRIL